MNLCQKEKRGKITPPLGMECAKPAVRHNSTLGLSRVVFILQKKIKLSIDKKEAAGVRGCRDLGIMWRWRRSSEMKLIKVPFILSGFASCCQVLLKEGPFEVKV